MSSQGAILGSLISSCLKMAQANVAKERFDLVYLFAHLLLICLLRKFIPELSLSKALPALEEVHVDRSSNPHMKSVE